MRAIELPAEQALVLQQVEAEGEEDFMNLAETLNYDKRRLAHIIHSLQNKGLVHVTWRRWDGLITLSARGRRLVTMLWTPPTAQPSY